MSFVDIWETTHIDCQSAVTMAGHAYKGASNVGAYQIGMQSRKQRLHLRQASSRAQTSSMRGEGGNMCDHRSTTALPESRDPPCPVM